MRAIYDFFDLDRNVAQGQRAFLSDCQTNTGSDGVPTDLKGKFLRKSIAKSIERWFLN